MLKTLLVVIFTLAVLYPLNSLADGKSESVTDTTSPDIFKVYPIVNATQGQLFGAVSSSDWISAEKTAPYLAVGETYHLYGLTLHHGAQALRSITPPKETCNNNSVKFFPLPQAQHEIFAVGGVSWEALPRVPTVQDTNQQVYLDIVSDYIRSHGIINSKINITQILRIDLEGDNTDEVIISAHLRRGLGTSAKAGDYAVLILRKIVEGNVRTIPIEEEYYPSECIMECAPVIYRAEAVLDVNGDGLMEIIIGFDYYEGKGNSIYSVVGDQVQKHLSWICGV